MMDRCTWASVILMIMRPSWLPAESSAGNLLPFPWLKSLPCFPFLSTTIICASSPSHVFLVNQMSSKHRKSLSGSSSLWFKSGLLLRFFFLLSQLKSKKILHQTKSCDLTKNTAFKKGDDDTNWCLLGTLPVEEWKESGRRSGWALVLVVFLSIELELGELVLL